MDVKVEFDNLTSGIGSWERKTISNILDKFPDTKVEPKGAILPPKLDHTNEQWLSFPENGVNDAESIREFKEYWESCGLNPAILELILSKVTIITPELAKEAENFMLDSISRKLEAMPSEETMLIVHGGSRSGAHLEKIVSERFPDEVGKRLFFANGGSHSKTRDRIHMNRRPDNIVFVEDAIYTGDQMKKMGDIITMEIETRFLKDSEDSYVDLKKLYYPNKLSVIVEGSTARIRSSVNYNIAVQFGELENHEYNFLESYFTIPCVEELFTKEEFAVIAAAFTKLLSTETTYHPSMIYTYMDWTRRTLTLWYNKVPDYVSFPQILTSYRGVKKKSGGFVHLFSNDRGGNRGIY